MYCINCGFKRSLYDKFCKWCGPNKGWLTPFGTNVTGEDRSEKKSRIARAVLNLKDPHPGDEIAFGTINREKICWKVLQIQDDKAFLLSREELSHFVLDEETRVYGASWWLRSPGDDQKSVPIVDHEGYMRPGVSVQAFNGVRPAMWIKIV